MFVSISGKERNTLAQETGESIQKETNSEKIRRAAQLIEGERERDSKTEG
jgi:hypothetical protein